LDSNTSVTRRYANDDATVSEPRELPVPRVTQYSNRLKHLVEVTAGVAYAVNTFVTAFAENARSE
jgi:hypothetical protein